MDVALRAALIARGFVTQAELDANEPKGGDDSGQAQNIPEEVQRAESIERTDGVQSEGGLSPGQAVDVT